MKTNYFRADANIKFFRLKGFPFQFSAIDKKLRCWNEYIYI